MPVFFMLGIFFILSSYLFLAKTNKACAGIADHVVINELSIDSVINTGGTDDDWVELYNPTNQAVVLDGWSLQKTSASGATSSLVKIALNGSIPANGYFLIVRDNASTSPALKNLADLKSDTFSLAENNIVFLVNNNIKIMDSQDSDIVDFVGFGSANYFEGAAAAPDIVETKSIARIPAGEDTNQNSIDFVLQASSTPQNSSQGNNNIGGTVLLTITPDINPVQNITPTGAEIVFQVNTNSLAKINYGASSAYGSSTASAPVLENTVKNINLTGLQCNTTYHYSIYAENASSTENDITDDAIFTTLPCGISLNSLIMTKVNAKANNKYTDGWEWEFNITVWDFNEATLKMKFDQWTGAGSLNTAANMQFSIDNANWIDITSNGAYPLAGADISGTDNSANAGRQVKIIVKMKVPIGTISGKYNSNFGILTE